MLFAVCAVAAQLDRNYIREKTLEGQQVAASKGNHGGRPKVIDDDMLVFARALRDRGTPIGEIAQKLTIATGKNAGQHSSVASLYRALAGFGIGLGLVAILVGVIAAVRGRRMGRGSGGCTSPPVAGDDCDDEPSAHGR